MDTMNTLPAETREDLIRRAWYSHDARWYMLVAREFGFEVANRLNHAAVRAIGELEATRLARATGTSPARSVDDFLAFMDGGRQIYVAPPLIELAARKTSEHEYEIDITRCFVAQNITKAGIGDQYECAVFDRVQGWHNALGIPLAEEPPATHCPAIRGAACHRSMTIREA